MKTSASFEARSAPSSYPTHTHSVADFSMDWQLFESVVLCSADGDEDHARAFEKAFVTGEGIVNGELSLQMQQLQKIAGSRVDLKDLLQSRTAQALREKAKQLGFNMNLKLAIPQEIRRIEETAEADGLAAAAKLVPAAKRAAAIAVLGAALAGAPGCASVQERAQTAAWETPAEFIRNAPQWAQKLHADDESPEQVALLLSFAADKDAGTFFEQSPVWIPVLLENGTSAKTIVRLLSYGLAQAALQLKISRSGYIYSDGDVPIGRLIRYNLGKAHPMPKLNQAIVDVVRRAMRESLDGRDSDGKRFNNFEYLILETMIGRPFVGPIFNPIFYEGNVIRVEFRSPPTIEVLRFAGQSDEEIADMLVAGILSREDPVAAFQALLGEMDTIGMVDLPGPVYSAVRDKIMNRPHGSIEFTMPKSRSFENFRELFNANRPRPTDDERVIHAVTIFYDTPLILVTDEDLENHRKVLAHDIGLHPAGLTDEMLRDGIHSHETWHVLREYFNGHGGNPGVIDKEEDERFARMFERLFILGQTTIPADIEDDLAKLQAVLGPSVPLRDLILSGNAKELHGKLKALGIDVEVRSASLAGIEKEKAKAAAAGVKVMHKLIDTAKTVVAAGTLAAALAVTPGCGAHLRVADMPKSQICRYVYTNFHHRLSDIYDDDFVQDFLNSGMTRDEVMTLWFVGTSSFEFEALCYAPRWIPELRARLNASSGP